MDEGNGRCTYWRTVLTAWELFSTKPVADAPALYADTTKPDGHAHELIVPQRLPALGHVRTALLNETRRTLNAFSDQLFSSVHPSLFPVLLGDSRPVITVRSVVGQQIWDDVCCFGIPNIIEIQIRLNASGREVSDT